MGNGIETRLPFLDYRLVEWALTLDPRLNLRDGRVKRVVRDAVTDTLPPQVVWTKKKAGFYIPFVDRWPEHRTQLREVLEEAECLEPLLDMTTTGIRAVNGSLSRR